MGWRDKKNLTGVDRMFRIKPTQILPLLLLLSTPVNSRAQGAAARPAPDPNKFAVILSGASGDEEFAKRFKGWTAELRGALVERFGFDEARITVLTETPEGRALRATAEEVRRAFASLKTAAGPDSMVFVFLIGHGTFDGRQAKFSLVGPDMAAAEYAELLGGLSARRVVVLNMASASGEFIKPLAGRGRVVITA